MFWQHIVGLTVPRNKAWSVRGPFSLSLHCPFTHSRCWLVSLFPVIHVSCRDIPAVQHPRVPSRLSFHHAWLSSLWEHETSHGQSGKLLLCDLLQYQGRNYEWTVWIERKELVICEHFTVLLFWFNYDSKGWRLYREECNGEIMFFFTKFYKMHLKK